MASNMGPLAAVKGSLHLHHEGYAADLTESQAFLESVAGHLYVVDFASKSALLRAMGIASRATGIASRAMDSSNISSTSSNPRWIYLAEILREDAQQFFAFASLYDRDLFNAVMQVKDVGPKTAALIVAELGAENILRLMQQGVWKGLKIAGVGPKTWESIVFGLNKKKKSLLPLLNKAQQQTGSSSTAKNLRTNSENENNDSERNPTWTPALFASDALITMFEGLGLSATQTNALYSECAREIKNFHELTDAQKVPELLKVHGRGRQHAPHARL